jgi:hypothetical protein
MINDDRLEQILLSNNHEVYISELLEGIQDMNWPNAERIVEILKPISKQSLPYVKLVLNSDDTVWKYWVLNQLVCNWPKDLVMEIESDLIDMSIKFDVEEELDLTALRILLEIGLYNREELRILLESKLKFISKELEIFSKEQVAEFKMIEISRIDIIFSKPALIMDFLRDNSAILNIKHIYDKYMSYLRELLEIKQLFER